MKRYGNLYEKIYSMENLRLAHLHARQKKTWYKEVRMVDENPDYYLGKLQEQLINHTYKTSEYETFIKKEKNGKIRTIYKLPYYPDRICQWAILLVIEPILVNCFIANTFSAIPNRGTHKCLHKVIRALQRDPENTMYCLKMDVKKYYPSINHDVLKSLYRRKFKDKNLLWLLDEIIDSTEGDTGIPIGNYISQYSGNFYLTPLDHYVKEQRHIKYYYRYMDDIVILHNSKEYLHELRKDIDGFLTNKLKLTMKGNWQVFPVDVRGIDFVGYRIFRDYILLRKSTCNNYKQKMKEIENQGYMTQNDWCAFQSYKGILSHCDSYRLSQKYSVPLQPYADFYYSFHIKKIKKERKR